MATEVTGLSVTVIVADLTSGDGVSRSFNLINRLQLPSAPKANFLAPASFGQFFNTFGRTEGFGTWRQIQFAVRYLF